MESQNKPSGNGYWQQRLWSWDPVLTPSVIVMLLGVLGVVALPIGITIFVQSNDLYSQTVKYGGSGDSDIDCSSHSCIASFTIDKDMDGPLYLYYELTNFYQNNIKYQKSIPWTQLSGDTSETEEDLALICDPLVTNGTDVLNPCGLVSNSFFTDRYGLISATSTINGVNPATAGFDESQLVFTSPDYFQQPNDFDFSSISGSCPSECGTITQKCESCGEVQSPCKCWKDPMTSTSYMYHYPDDDTTDYLYEMYPNQINPIEGVTNEHFKVWMTIAGLPTFRKPYGKIDGPFKSGDVVKFSVQSYYDVKKFDGTKSLVLTERYSLGLPNAGIGTTFIVCGTLSIAVAIAFLFKQEVYPRPLGSPAVLNWN